MIETAMPGHAHHVSSSLSLAVVIISSASCLPRPTSEHHQRNQSYTRDDIIVYDIPVYMSLVWGGFEAASGCVIAPRRPSNYKLVSA